MVLKYSKLFTVTGANTDEPVTVLVESIETNEGLKNITISTLEGEYGSARDFEASLDYTLKRWEHGDISTRKDAKMWTFLSFMLSDTGKLVDALNEALAASEEG